MNPAAGRYRRRLPGRGKEARGPRLTTVGTDASGAVPEPGSWIETPHIS